METRRIQLAHWTPRNRNGRLLAPCGSSRDLFLHVKDEFLDEAEALLCAQLEGEALVLRTNAMMEDGFFGVAPCSDLFRRNAGNLLVLPLGQKSVFWRGGGRYESGHKGNHGGMSVEEMEIPFIVVS